MSHPMFDRITRRMEVLQREIDRTHKAGEGPAHSRQTKPDTHAAPRGILASGGARPKPQG